MRGGFEVEHDPVGHIDAVRSGIPLRGGLLDRDLRDLWTLCDAPVGWPLTTEIAHVGVPVTAAGAAV